MNTLHITIKTTKEWREHKIKRIQEMVLLSGGDNKELSDRLDQYLTEIAFY